MNQQKPAGRASDDASRPEQDIPDFLVEAAEAKPQHISGARDAGAAPDQRPRAGEKNAGPPPPHAHDFAPNIRVRGGLPRQPSPPFACRARRPPQAARLR